MGLVYVLLAHFRVACHHKVKSNQGSARMGELPVEATLNIFDKLLECPSAEGIQVLGEEGPSKTVTLTCPTPNMLSHVRPLYVRPILDGVPMAKILADNGAAIYILPIPTS